MTEPVDSALVRDVARLVITEAAPAELPLFGPISEQYLADSGRALSGRNSADETLGFGMAAAGMLLTPVALAVVTDVLKHLAGQMLNSTLDRSAQATRDRLRRLFHVSAPGEPADVPRLTPEQLGEVRSRTLEKARLLKLPADRAELLADAIAGSLAARP